MLHACHIYIYIILYIIITHYNIYMQCKKQDVEIVHVLRIMLYKLQTFWFKEQVPLDSRIPTEVTP